MYEVDERDTVHELTDVPPSSPGAPLPLVLSDESSAFLAYYLYQDPPGEREPTLEDIEAASNEETIAIVSFERYHALMFGPPNDEAFDGHPLASRGLEPYAAFEVVHSSWVRRLERMNEVHDFHRADMFADLKHFIFAFHDSTFECVAQGFRVRTLEGSMDDALTEIRQHLDWEPR